MLFQWGVIRKDLHQAQVSQLLEMDTQCSVADFSFTNHVVRHSTPCADWISHDAVQFSNEDKVQVDCSWLATSIESQGQRPEPENMERRTDVHGKVLHCCG